MRNPKVKAMAPKYVLSDDEEQVILSQVSWLRYAMYALKDEYPLTNYEALSIAAQMLVARAGDRLEMDYTGPDEIMMDY